MQLVPITTTESCSGEVYSIQNYVIKFVNDLWKVDGFIPSTPVSSTSNTDRHDITEILFKVVLNTILPFLLRKHTQ